MREFSEAELRAIQKSLFRRFRKRAEIADIGFGPGVRANRQDPQRPASVCFYVRKKRTPRDREKHIPPTVKFRLKRRGKMRQFELPTDVIEVKKLVLSGVPMSFSGGGSVTGGVLVVWKEPSQTYLTWGLITVRHAFPASLSLPQSRANIRIAGAGSSRLSGTLLAVSSSARLDASLIRVKRFDLVAANIMDPTQGTNGLAVRTVDQLRDDEGASGVTRPRNTDRQFTVRTFIPVCHLFEQQIGVIDSVVHAHYAANQTFSSGTSGSLWRIANISGAIQFGGMSPAFREGFGQSLELVMAWAKETVDDLFGIEPDSFRYVARI